MGVLMVQAWHCDQCSHLWLSQEKPKRCSKCKSSRWDGGKSGDDRGAGVGEAGAIERGGDATAVSILQKGKGGKKQLHTVQPVRDELERGSGHISASVESHAGHLTFRAGDGKYCSTCNVHY